MFQYQVAYLEFVKISRNIVIQYYNKNLTKFNEKRQWSAQTICIIWRNR